MSWDNVADIKNIKIWTDYSDSTQGHLFINNSHQLKLNVGISFTLKSGATEGPTEDEVSNALSLINNQDSGPLKYLKLTSEGKFTQVYDPNHVQSTADITDSDVEDGIYDFVFTYWVYSPTSINAEAHAESLALELAYTITNADGTTTQVVKQTSAPGNYYTKTCVNVLCYPEKLYGNKEENRTNILIGNKKVASSDCSDKSGNFSHAGDTFIVYWVYIDDSYFKLFYFDGCSEPDSNYIHQGFYIHKDYSSPEWDHIFNSFFPNVKCGEFSFGTQVEVRSGPDKSYACVLRESITVHQQENQITFISGFASAKGLKYAGEVNNYQKVRAYDQFGNSTYIIVKTNYDYVTDDNSGHIVLCSVN